MKEQFEQLLNVFVPDWQNSIRIESQSSNRLKAVEVLGGGEFQIFSLFPLDQHYFNSEKIEEYRQLLNYDERLNRYSVPWFAFRYELFGGYSRAGITPFQIGKNHFRKLGEQTLLCDAVQEFVGICRRHNRPQTIKIVDPAPQPRIIIDRDIDAKSKALLRSAGIEIEQLPHVKDEVLLAVRGIGRKRLDSIREIYPLEIYNH